MAGFISRGTHYPRKGYILMGYNLRVRERLTFPETKCYSF